MQWTHTLKCVSIIHEFALCLYTQLYSILNYLLTFSDKSLVLSDIGPDDSGTYVCNASNPGGSVQESYEVDIKCKNIFRYECLVYTL